MLKKILCLAMILVMVASMAVIGVSAADDTTVYFEVPSDWNNYTNVFCHIFPYGGGDPLANWQSKKERATLVEGRLYSYDISKVGGLQAGTTYGIIFSLDTGMETYTTLMSTACYGDTLYCNDTLYENPVDSSKTSRAAFWKDHSASQYGPLMQVTSIGNIVGTCIAPGATAQSMFTDFLTNSFDDAQTYSGKTDQAIIDDIAKILGLGQDSIKELIAKSGLTIDWKGEESKAPQKDEGMAANPGATSTGQEMTIVYIAIAMMFASAAVVFFARKKRVTE